MQIHDLYVAYIYYIKEENVRLRRRPKGMEFEGPGIFDVGQVSVREQTQDAGLVVFAPR